MTSEMVELLSESYGRLVTHIRANQDKIQSLKKRIEELEKKIEGS